MKRTVFAAAAWLATGAAGFAQEPRAPEAPRPAQSVDTRRDDVRAMEGILTQALQRGAQDLARQLKVSEPNSAFVTGTGRVRGFLLEGYGAFFDVDVPGMRQSVVWSAQMIELAQQRETFRRFLAEAAPNHPARRLVEVQLRQIERMMSGQAVPVPLPLVATANAEQVAPPGVVTPMTVSEASNGAGRAADASAVPAPVAAMRDPNELYTDSVKNALIDAMLKHSAFLKIADNEWLTVAASDSDGPQIPGQLDDASRIVIRVRGSDLTAFQSGKLTREEVMKRVEVKEF